MNQRISLSRIIALNWYGFRQIIDLDDNVLISGAYGTGKSALLDLMQYVLLGEHWRANRAAAGTARGRDLVSYCLGDTNQTRNGERHFVRSSGVTLAALEFTRPPAAGKKKAQRETWGIRLEYSSATAQPKHTYFYIPDRLEYAEVAPNNKMLDDEAFRTWIRREYGKDCLFAGQRDYLAEMGTSRHLYFDFDAFRRTFPKAIAFEPEENVEKFIREFILEDSPLDVRDVRTALRAYDETRRRLAKQEDEAAFLRRIVEQHELYESSRRQEAVLLHCQHSLRLMQAQERFERHAFDLKQLQEEHAADLKQLEQAVADSENVGKLLSEVRFEIQKDANQIKFDQLDRQKRELQARVTSLQEAQKSVRQRLAERHYRWMQWLKHGGGLPLEKLASILQVEDALLANLRSGKDAERFEALPKLSSRFNEIWREVEHLLQPLQRQIEAAAAQLKQLAADLENLSRGQAPGSFPVFQTLRQKLGDRVEQLGRLIEVKPEAERWWPALELFLGRQRWVIVPADQATYREALDLLRRTPPGREPEALLNPAELRQLRAGSRTDSLFAKVQVTHTLARNYVEHLLGEVQCVETVEELERSESGRAITPEGIFKQAPLRRRLKPANAVELTLGREGLERMRNAKEREQIEVRALQESLKQRLSDVQVWLDTGRNGGLGDPALPDRAGELPQLPQLEAELGRVRETINLLITPELEARQKRLNELETDQRKLNEAIGNLRGRNEGFNLKARPLREQMEAAEEDAREFRLEVEESRVRLGRDFVGILDINLEARRDALKAEFPKWSDCFNAVQDRATKAGREAVEAKGKRQNERILLATARDEHGHLKHPEYQHDFQPEDEGNGSWTTRLRLLETVELQKSRELAEARKRDWERRLQDSVLNELNHRIQEAQGTIKLLDRYLSAPVGRSRYRISQRRDPAFATLWRLLDSGLEATDPLAAAIQESEMQRAKDELMAAVDAADQSDERARRLLDYRNYHHYDIEIVPADKPDAPPISLGRSGRNLSGGENQAPFFISMLAAFRRVYDLGSGKSQHLGLVVMDEAFSKLSGDGIEDCLALARNFQLQLVMAFPPERLGVMVPHAQTVIMCQKEVKRDANGYVTGIDNIPLLSTMAEAVEALA